MKHTNEPPVPPGVLTLDQLRVELAELLGLDRADIWCEWNRRTRRVDMDTIPSDLRDPCEKRLAFAVIGQRHSGKPLELPRCQCCGGSGVEAK